MMCIMKGCRLYDQIRRRISAQCGKLGWGMDDLARAAGVHRNTAGTVRAGKGNPGIRVLEKMLDALDAAAAKHCAVDCAPTECDGRSTQVNSSTLRCT